MILVCNDIWKRWWKGSGIWISFEARAKSLSSHTGCQVGEHLVPIPPPLLYLCPPLDQSRELVWSLLRTSSHALKVKSSLFVDECSPGLFIQRQAVLNEKGAL